jgi:hypothetical protein
MAIFFLAIPVFRAIVRAGARPASTCHGFSGRKKEDERSTIQEQKADMVHSFVSCDLFINSMGGQVPPWRRLRSSFPGSLVLFFCF